MTLPVLPEVDTILANSASVLRDVVLPSITEEWPRSCTRVIAGALEYAVGLLRGDRSLEHRAELESALAQVASACPGEFAELATGSGSAFERSSAVLVRSRQVDGAASDEARAILHAVLLGQLEREANEAETLLTALHVAMRGNEQQ